MSRRRGPRGPTVSPLRVWLLGVRKKQIGYLAQSCKGTKKFLEKDATRNLKFNTIRSSVISGCRYFGFDAGYLDSPFYWTKVQYTVLPLFARRDNHLKGFSQWQRGWRHEPMPTSQRKRWDEALRRIDLRSTQRRRGPDRRERSSRYRKHLINNLITGKKTKTLWHYGVPMSRIRCQDCF